MMKEALLKGNLDRMGEILNYGWSHKKNTAAEISSPVLEEIYESALRVGATGGKISGVGGGGYMMFYCPGMMCDQVIEALSEFGGEVHRLAFDDHGLSTWEIK